MDYFTVMLLAILAVFVYGGYRDYSRRKKRRASLRRDETAGVWVWMELDRVERQSPIHPDEPGGAWNGVGGGNGDNGGDGD